MGADAQTLGQINPVSPVNPLDVQNTQAEGSQLVQNIVSTETSTGEKAILGAAPEVDSSLLENLTPPKSLLLVILKVLFAVLLIGSVASILFFSSQLTNVLNMATEKLGFSNISKELASSNAEIINSQTEINFYRYLKL